MYQKTDRTGGENKRIEKIHRKTQERYGVFGIILNHKIEIVFYYKKQYTNSMSDFDALTGGVSFVALIIILFVLGVYYLAIGSKLGLYKYTGRLLYAQGYTDSSNNNVVEEIFKLNNNSTCTVTRQTLYTFRSDAIDAANSKILGTYRSVWKNTVASNKCYDETNLSYYTAIGSGIMSGFAFVFLVVLLCLAAYYFDELRKFYKNNPIYFTLFPQPKTQLREVNSDII